MDLAGDGLREGAHMGSLFGRRRQQGRLGMGFVEILHDGKGLGQRRAVVEHQGGNQLLRVERPVIVRELLAAAADEMHGDAVVGQALQGQGDPHPVGGR